MSEAVEGYDREFTHEEYVQAEKSLEASSFAYSAKKKVKAPVMAVFEKFNPPGVNFLEPNAWKDNWPKDIDGEYSKEEILSDAREAADKYNLVMESKYGPDNYIPIEIEEAHLKSGRFVGYFVSGLPIKDLDFLEETREVLLKWESQKKWPPIKQYHVLFCPVGDKMASDSYYRKLGRRKLGERYMEFKEAILDGLTEGYRNSSNFDSLLSQKACYEGMPIFGGEDGEGFFGSKQEQFAMFLSEALTAEE